MKKKSRRNGEKKVRSLNTVRHKGTKQTKKRRNRKDVQVEEARWRIRSGLKGTRRKRKVIYKRLER